MKVFFAAALLGLAALSLAQATEQSRYGGSVYTGPASLNIGSSLIHAGGGVASNSPTKALRSMVGPVAAKTEVAKLTKQYSTSRVNQWLKVFHFAMHDFVRKIPTSKVTPSWAVGHDLVQSLVAAGTDKDGAFYTELMLDKCFSHATHMKVMADIDSVYGEKADSDFHRITNQAMHDLAVLTGDKTTKLSSFH